jgi:hypothetical protein
VRRDQNSAPPLAPHLNLKTRLNVAVGGGRGHDVSSADRSRAFCDRHRAGASAPGDRKGEVVPRTYLINARSSMRAHAS